jgi:LEA14-like dessication related protein
MKSNFIILLCLICGCSFINKRLAVKDLKFSYRGGSVEALTLDRIKLSIFLNAYNPNSIDAVIDRLDYTVYFEGVRAFSGYTNETYEIKANGERTITIFSEIVFADLPELFKTIKSSYGKSKVRVTTEIKPEIKTIVGKIRYTVKLDEYIPLNWK